MVRQLHQTLRSLCLDSGWKYAVFWKLKHRARMMLTWEDAYYYNNDNPEKACPGNFSDSFHDGNFSRDPLGLNVAKMSYHVYSLGEGVVGQVAVTGKHFWISADKHVTDSGSPFQYSDEWLTQFSAGIKTIAVVAVVPYGVIQLGSLDLIAEDLNMVNHIRHAFFELQDSLACYTPNVLAASMETYSLSDISTRTPNSGVYHDCMQNLDRAIDKYGVGFPSSICSAMEKPGHCSYNFSVPEKLVEMIDKPEALEGTMPECSISDNFLPPCSLSKYLEQQKHEQMVEIDYARHEGKSSGSNNCEECSESRNIPFTKNFCRNSNTHDAPHPADCSAMQISYLPSEVLDSTICHDERGMCVPELPSKYLHKDHGSALHMPLRSCAGYELYEALGPAFTKQNCHYEWGAENIETDMAGEMPEGMATSSMSKANSGTEHLLEAVVANISNNVIDKNDKSFFKSQFISNAEKNSETCTSDIGSLSSAGYSFDQETLNSLNSSGACGFHFSKSFSSINCSRDSGNLEKPQESVKVHKKRAKPGESCRPRPRDRQLIQDRIKELRELVPSGSKCSIDSLLERTIKHMIFMQGITKHAEKLNKYAGSQEPRIRGASCTERGSSWAVEVGSNLNVCPIVVENLSMDGQMLVEMLSEDCCHFLEIAEAIHGMGLIILKGITETCGEKTWMRFVVEGQNNRSFHRMDVLWSLMQLLQPKISI